MSKKNIKEPKESQEIDDASSSQSEMRENFRFLVDDVKQIQSQMEMFITKKKLKSSQAEFKKVIA